MWLAQYTAPIARLLNPATRKSEGELSYRQACEMMEAYYFNNDLYRTVSMALREQGYWSEPMRELRNPIYSAVEFYAMTLAPGQLPKALPIVTENARIVEPIKQLWKWSNFSQRKQAAVRQFANTGDLFLRVATKETPVERVYLQVVQSKNVTDFQEDERGNITWLRYDVEVDSESGDGSVEYHTEVWDAEQVQVWRHGYGVDCDLGRLGEPDTERSYMLADIGIDFVPWVHIKFMDVGDLRGLPLGWVTLAKIDEVNRKSTRLAQMLYPKVKWALKANYVDPQGRPMPAPKISNSGTTRENSDTITVGDEEFWRLPGNSTIEPLITQVDFAARLDAIQADMNEVYRDLPEAKYYELVQTGNISGLAVQYQMAPAINRVLEARGNFEAGLARAHAMALSIGQEARLWSNLGTFEAGDFEHGFEERDVLPLNASDKAGVAKTYTDMGVPLGMALERYAGWSAEETAKLPVTAPGPAPAQPTRTPQTREEAAPIFKAAAPVTPDLAGKLTESGMLTRVVNRMTAKAPVNG